MRGERAVGHQALQVEWDAGETADREQRAVHRDRRNHGVDARAVGQAGVDHRLGLVDPAPDLVDDALDHPEQVLFVGETDRRELQLAEPVDVDLVRRVHENVRDVGIL